MYTEGYTAIRVSAGVNGTVILSLRRKHWQINATKLALRFMLQARRAASPPLEHHTIDTYEEVCASGAGPCNPPASTCRLIDFATSPATRTRVTISEPTSPGQRVFAGRRDT